MLALLLSFSASRIHLKLNEQRQFVNWMRENNKIYIGEEYHLRLGIFLANFRYIQEFNKRKGLTFRLGINKFTCHTPAEYKALLISTNHVSKNPNQKREVLKTKQDIPDSWDWRDKGVVNPIRDQGQCAACFAFSAVATAEAAYAIKSGNLLDFSEQNLVDCAPSSGCHGGWPEDALEYVLRNQNGKFNSRADYPYTATDGQCSFDFGKAIGKIDQYKYVEVGNEGDLKEKVATLGVASICISAGNTEFMSYSGGILDDDLCPGARVDHAVNAVGYGSENGVEFWIVRNNFGENWGEDGYVRMIRNKGNLCRLTDYALVAIDTIG